MKNPDRPQRIEKLEELANYILNEKSTAPTFEQVALLLKETIHCLAELEEKHETLFIECRRGTFLL